MLITCIREYLKDSTPSDIYINGDWFCYCLEDVARPVNVKVPRETCIPEGVYHVAITPSNRFGRDMIQLYNDDGMIVRRDGKTFTGIRVHGGNDTGDTAGCPLVAAHKVSDRVIQGTMENALFQQVNLAIMSGDEVKWIVTSV